jgi:hypothetical protein
VGQLNSTYGLAVLLEFIRIIVASVSYVFYVTAVARGEVSFNNTFAKPLEMFAFIGMLWFVIFVFRYVPITIYFHMVTTAADKIYGNVQYLLLRQNLGNEVLEKVKLFSSQLTFHKIEFTVLGFFSVNLNELSTFVFSVVRYIIVFEQMKN